MLKKEGGRAHPRHDPAYITNWQWEVLVVLKLFIYFESIIHTNYYRKLLCIYSSFSLKHVSPPECFNLFFLRLKFMLRHLLPQPLLSLLPFNKWERETYKHTKLLIFCCTGVLAHLTVCTHTHRWELKSLHQGPAKTYIMLHNSSFNHPHVVPNP